METKEILSLDHTTLAVPFVQEWVKKPLTSVPPRYVHHDQDPPIISFNSSSPQVPVIDMQRLLSEDFMDSELQKLDQACREWGFFQLINHEVSSSLVEKVKLETEKFFKLPMEEKIKYGQPEGDVFHVEGYGNVFVGVMPLSSLHAVAVTTSCGCLHLCHLWPSSSSSLPAMAISIAVSVSVTVSVFVVVTLAIVAIFSLPLRKSYFLTVRIIEIREYLLFKADNNALQAQNQKLHAEAHCGSKGAVWIYQHGEWKVLVILVSYVEMLRSHLTWITSNGALLHLVNLLKRHKDGNGARAVYSVIRRAADAIANLAHENSSIKTCVRMEGGIPPLVELLEFTDTKVQRVFAGARGPWHLKTRKIRIRETMEAYSADLKNIMAEILRQIRKKLRMDETEMTVLLEGKQAMGFNYYPPCPQPEQVISLPPHSDFGGITFLLDVNGVQGL
ncbi:hypothetical protein EZV62_027081 [Acer yangbiense]|uniref:Uncharacterized protein n=1 Tax=Acer yangbiense TaxID=1000413 RepID=A0A5C7GTH2_9ROSI|nr:hypothetical protein EZV62_027081 [Acer yangbiense]